MTTEATNSLSGLAWTTSKPPLQPHEMAYWPLWVNVAVPLLGTLVFALVQALLLYIDDPGLRRAKQRNNSDKLAGRRPDGVDVAAAASVDVEKAVTADSDSALSANGQAQAATASTTSSDAGVQCELIKPADQPQQNPGASRRRTSSASSVPESDTMRLLEGMLLRPRGTLSRRRLSESEQQEPISESGGLGGAAGGGAAAAPSGVSVTQSLTGPGAKRFAAGLQHRLLAAKRQEQQGGRKGSASEA